MGLSCISAAVVLQVAFSPPVGPIRYGLCMVSAGRLHVQYCHWNVTDPSLFEFPCSDGHAVIATLDSLGQDIQSRDTETAARMALHAEAEAYNALTRSWPSYIVAQACGFRPWRYRGRRDS